MKNFSGAGFSALPSNPSPPVAVNASTTYGIDGSAANNYGLGRGFKSTAVRQRDAAAQKAAPSWWWLVGFLLLWVAL